MALLTLITLLLAQHDRFGVPACDGPYNEFADRAFFVLCHSSAHRVPVWVGYELTPQHLMRIARRSGAMRN